MNTLLASVDIQNKFFGTEGHPVGQVSGIRELVSQALPTFYTAAGVILFIYLLVGGFIFVTSANNPDGSDEGKKAITNAIIGFAVIFASYWIIQIIQTLTGVNIIGS